MIKFEKLTMPAAAMGRPNPLPDIKNIRYIHATYKTTDNVTEEEKTYIGKGRIPTLIPYLIQDEYDREKKTKDFCAAVLENDYIKAVFLPELGGRLWSLFDKKKGKELLYVNPVFQPCNLALRNAWFSGGVEFNVGIRGHNPLTCSPLWCSVDKYPQGDVLRLYEYERIRDVVYSISAYLPDDSSVLYIKCKIENKSKEEKYMYWWSNIAVPETPETRVLVPAEETFLTIYSEDGYLVDKVPVPMLDGADISYPKNVLRARDFFYKIKDDSRKWVISADKDGFGLLQCSTKMLKGRKLFVWGMGRGGRHWNEWLSVRDSAYVEIQAGLTNTQFEHIPMKGETTWEWIEAYTAFDAPKDVVHSDYKSAVDYAETYINSKLGNPDNLSFPDEKDLISSEIICKGSDWAALEEMAKGEKLSTICLFPKSDDEETQIWTNLLKTNTFPAPQIWEEPTSYVTGSFWLEKLEKIENKNWFSLLHSGVIRYAMGDVLGAKNDWETSVSLEKNPWALRNLAMIYKNEESDFEKAKEYILLAYVLKKDCISIIKELAVLLTSYDDDKLWLEIYSGLLEWQKIHPRLRMYTAVAFLHLDMLEEAREIINENFVMSDIQEGELSISYYWFELYRKIYAKETGGKYDPADKEFCKKADEKYPLPKSLDFRMNS